MCVNVVSPVNFVWDTNFFVAWKFLLYLLTLNAPLQKVGSFIKESVPKYKSNILLLWILSDQI